MTTEQVCYWLICFVPPSVRNVPRIFGFAEFISSLALLVITYTLVDIRYRFRIAIAPIPLYRLTFILMSVIGAETLLTELWLAEGWWLPQTAFLNQALWQSIFGALFLVTFLTWVWYAYIRPPVYGRQNAKRYAQEMFSIVLKGAGSELSVIADEIRRSAKSLVEFAPSTARHSVPNVKAVQFTEVEGYANDLLLLIANRKLCRHIIQSAPATAITIFEEAVKAQKFHLPLGTFAKNISAEAIANSDSILYHETDEYSSGLMGYIKPFSQAIYGNYQMVESLGDRHGSPLDIDYREYNKWDARQWKAFCGVTLITLGAYLRETRGGEHSFVIYRALGTIQSAFRDAYQLNEITADYYSTDIFQRLQVAVDFISDVVKEIDKQEHPPTPFKLRKRKDDRHLDIYDNLANLMFEVVLAASAISGPPDKAWFIQHNAVWGEFFDLSTNGSTWKILQFKLRRLMYNEIAHMDEFQNFKGARILGFCLNVMGLKLATSKYGREYRALAKAVHAWARRGYPKLRNQLPRVADAVLMGGITYDEQHNRLVQTSLSGLRTEPYKEYLQLADTPEQATDSNTPQH